MDGVGKFGKNEKGRMEGSLDGIGKFRETKDGMKGKIEGFGSIEARENPNGSMEITIRMGATKAYLATAVAAVGATMTLY